MHRTDRTVSVRGRQRHQIRFHHRAKNGVEDLEKALWYLDHATPDALRPMPCASNSKACHLLRVLERADWQVMAPFWKGMWELAQGYDSGLTRARRTVRQRVKLYLVKSAFRD